MNLTAAGQRPPMVLEDRTHFVNGRNLLPPFAAGLRQIRLGMGCYWGVERLFWSLPGIWVTAVGFAGGDLLHPTYKESCSGRTGHTEVVLLVYDPTILSLESILKIFWENHDPTQLNRQGNDIGPQYRSAIFVDSAEDLQTVQTSQQSFQKQLDRAGFGKITTEVALRHEFFYAHSDHQQYLARYPDGYCGLKGTGVVCPLPTVTVTIPTPVHS
ncbi:MAG: peptide-methionine (S)-S-oxide reductase MsrA [Candidatus Pacebacteria bacterium]|nr:peptide-methionine (S)-S-oxide reductase MsrA [Candidatus Paceibacterota bacterium]